MNDDFEVRLSANARYPCDAEHWATYSGSTKKLDEHGGFAHDDTNVMMLLSNPNFAQKNGDELS